jgi:hypothetical protein
VRPRFARPSRSVAFGHLHTDFPRQSGTLPGTSQEALGHFPGFRALPPALVHFIAPSDTSPGPSDTSTRHSGIYSVTRSFPRHSGTSSGPSGTSTGLRALLRGLLALPHVHRVLSRGHRALPRGLRILLRGLQSLPSVTRALPLGFPGAIGHFHGPSGISPRLRALPPALRHFHGPSSSAGERRRPRFARPRRSTVLRPYPVFNFCSPLAIPADHRLFFLYPIPTSIPIPIAPHSLSRPLLLPFPLQRPAGWLLFLK